jgi:hypothetical protein
VQYACALFEEHPRDEQPTVAVLGVLLGTQHRDPPRRDPTPQLLETPSECLGARHRVVPYVATLVVEVRVLRSASELAPEKDVSHTDSLQRVEERLTVKPRRVARGRPGAHVGDALNVVCAQQRQEVLQSVV